MLIFYNIEGKEIDRKIDKNLSVFWKFAKLNQNIVKIGKISQHFFKCVKEFKKFDTKKDLKKNICQNVFDNFIDYKIWT